MEVCFENKEFESKMVKLDNLQMPLIYQGKGGWNMVKGEMNLVIGGENLAKGRKRMRR